jgi:hypothetical protein
VQNEHAADNRDSVNPDTLPAGLSGLPGLIINHSRTCAARSAFFRTMAAGGAGCAGVTVRASGTATMFNPERYGCEQGQQRENRKASSKLPYGEVAERGYHPVLSA